MISRPYQDTAVTSTFRSWEDHSACMVVMPTGCGKTIVFAKVIERMVKSGVCMVVAHRRELIQQAADKIFRVTGITPAIEMADQKTKMSGDLFGGPRIVVASLQTLTSGGDGAGRMSKFDPNAFSCLILDECHHAISQSNMRVIEWFKNNKNLKILGVTATPDRADEVALGKVFEDVAFEYELEDAIEDGWLVPICPHFIPVSGLDYSSVRTTAGDLNNADLAKILESEENLHRIADPVVRLTGNARTLIFAATVEQAGKLSEIINRHKPGTSGWVCGETPEDERRKSVSEFDSGALQYMVNVGVFTEGFDNPFVEYVVMGRPTKSRALFSQMVGRATRTLPGVVDGIDTPAGRRAAIAASAKKRCVVMDFVGNAGKHKLVHATDILGGRFDDDVVERVYRKALASGVPVDISEELKNQIELDRMRRAAEEARRAKVIVRAQYDVVPLEPFNPLSVEPERERGWDTGKVLSEKQQAILVKNGIDPASVPYHKGKQILADIFRRWDRNLLSLKQEKLLAKHRPDLNLSGMTFQQASQEISAIAKQKGWAERRKP